MRKLGLALVLSAATAVYAAPATAKPLLPVIKQLPGGTLPSPFAPLVAACPQQRCELPPVHGFVAECSHRERDLNGWHEKRDGCSVTSHRLDVDCSTLDYDLRYEDVRQVGCNERVAVPDGDLYFGQGCSHAGIGTGYDTLGCSGVATEYYESPDGASFNGIPLPGL